MMTIRYPTADELIYMNGRLPGNAAILDGERQIRDIDLLDAAVARPAQSAFGVDAYPTLPEKAAALLHAVARNHPFADGNKRTATLAALFMLAVNGQRARWDPAEALEAIVNVAAGRSSVAQFAAWLPLSPGAPAPQPDAEADTCRIERLLNEHQWLLKALAGR